MQKEFVPYELALKLKPIGFEDECIAYYQMSLTEVEHKEDGKSGPFGWKKGEISFEKRYFINNFKGIDYSNEDWIEFAAPTFSQAFRWFREKYGYWSYVKEATKGTCRFYIEKFDEKFFNSDIIDSYEEAELACLTKLIEIAETQ